MQVFEYLVSVALLASMLEETSSFAPIICTVYPTGQLVSGISVAQTVADALVYCLFLHELRLGSAQNDLISCPRVCKADHR